MADLKIPGGARGKPAQILVLSVGLVLFAMIFMGSCTTYVHPNEVGVLESRFGGGVMKGTLKGGRLYLLTPGETIHTFPADIQILQLSGNANDRVPGQPFMDAMEVNTSDGSKVSVDVAVMFHVEDAYKVMTESGGGDLYITNAVLPKTIAAMKKNMGEMLAENFYDVATRTAKTEAARAQMTTELADHGIRVDQVLIRQYHYNGDYEKQIEDKKIQDQLVFTNQAKALANQEKAKLQQIQAEGQANVNIETQTGTAEVTKIQAEADKYKRTREADANLLVQLATAKGTELENSAYQGAGSENLVGMKMADVLNGMDVILVPVGGKNGINPLDLDQELKLFDVRQP